MSQDAIVLYAEDNPADIALMERAFAKAGLPEMLRTVTDGQQAIDYLAGKGTYGNREKYPPAALLLVDLKMPYKSGFDVIRWVSRHMDSLPTVVLTSSEADPDIKRAYRLGANSYLVKPPTLEKITTLVKNLDRYWLNMNHVPARKD